MYKCTDIADQKVTVELNGQDLIQIHNDMGYYLKAHMEDEHDIDCEDCLKACLNIFESVREATDKMETKLDAKAK